MTTYEIVFPESSLKMLEVSNDYKITLSGEVDSDIEKITVLFKGIEVNKSYEITSVILDRVDQRIKISKQLIKEVNDATSKNTLQAK
jgi:hypothetical protein